MELNKKNLLKFIKDEKLKFNDLESIDEAFYCITSNDFAFYWEMNIRNTRGEGDHWLEASYYSNKINKTIVWNENFRSEFETAEEFIDTLLSTNKKIIDFEKKLK